MKNRWLVWLVLISLTVFFLFGCTSSQEQPVKPADNSTNITINPIHTAADVSKYLQKYLIIYYGLWNVDIQSPVYSGGNWTTDVKAYADEGGYLVLRITVNDSELAVDDMWQKIFLLKEPIGITPIKGKVSCSAGRIKIMEFANPYCPNCVASETDIRNFWKRFNSSIIDYEYHVMLPETNSMIQAYGYENVSLTSKYYACIGNQSVFPEFRECVMEKYSRQVGKPLLENQLDSCAIDTNVSISELKECIKTADKILSLDMKLGETYLGTNIQLPSFVVDCRFKTTSPNLLRYAICYEFPKTEGC